MQVRQTGVEADLLVSLIVMHFGLRSVSRYKPYTIPARQKTQPAAAAQLLACVQTSTPTKVCTVAFQNASLQPLKHPIVEP
jgi:hypothetical protein